jgi:hypothetical protein
MRSASAGSFSEEIRMFKHSATLGGSGRSIMAAAERYSFLRRSAYAFFTAASAHRLFEKSFWRNLDKASPPPIGPLDALARPRTVDHFPSAA